MKSVLADKCILSKKPANNKEPIVKIFGFWEQNKAKRYCFLASMAAKTKPLNNGLALSGLEVNSGWNWQAMKNG